MGDKSNFVSNILKMISSLMDKVLRKDEKLLDSSEEIINEEPVMVETEPEESDFLKRIKVEQFSSSIRQKFKDFDDNKIDIKTLTMDELEKIDKLYDTQIENLEMELTKKKVQLSMKKAKNSQNSAK